jgi:hypothetical protein
MDDYVQSRRDEAKDHRGVWYDSRADKFVAEVYSNGERHFLGHFPTADAAADAYATARAELPSGRSGEGTFVSAFQSFLDTCERDKKGAPALGETLTYKDQPFYFDGVVFRALKDRRRPFYKWASTCAVCGGPYDTMTATSPKVAKGITRTCETHRSGGRGSQRKASASRQSTSVDLGTAPQEWIDAANAALDALSLVSDEFEPAAFVAACWDGRARPKGFLRFLLTSPQSPVISRDGKFFPRNT